MKARRRPVKSTDVLAGAWLPGAGAFRIDARIGHAWFVRTDGSAGLPARRRETLPVLRQAELSLREQGRAVGRRATRIPPHALVPVSQGHLALPYLGPAMVGSAGLGANDNAAPGTGYRRTALRETLFLLIFAATLAGTYYVGRLHAFQNVIVVPDTRSRTVTIT